MQVHRHSGHVICNSLERKGQGLCRLYVGEEREGAWLV